MYVIMEWYMYVIITGHMYFGSAYVLWQGICIMAGHMCIMAGHMYVIIAWHLYVIMAGHMYCNYGMAYVCRRQ